MIISSIKVAELFAGVGGFRLALDGHQDTSNQQFNMPSAGNFQTVWANQWEPPGTGSRQFAANCYTMRFHESPCLVNEDISLVLDKMESGELSIPDFQLLVGGFPCQDYSVAKPLSAAGGITGKKGVLWWDIYRILTLKKPDYVLLENVDRLLKSPSTQRGRDFAIMLSCFYKLGYSVEWRVINAAEYGFAQRRRRVFIFAVKTQESWSLEERAIKSGVIAEAFPVDTVKESSNSIKIYKDPYKVTETFGIGDRVSLFKDAGAMQNGRVYAAKTTALFDGRQAILGDIVVDDKEVPESFFIYDDKLDAWKYLKGAKKEARKNKVNGFAYNYSEGSMSFPDPLDKPARTILTGEGGSGASRFKHVIRNTSGRYRRLIPDELDQLQGFPRGWTATGMSDGHRAFCMGNALVVGIPHKIGKALWRRVESKVAV